MTFFSHINASKTAQTVHDQYWHSHIAAGIISVMPAARRLLEVRQLEFMSCTKDTEQYGTFAYTVLLYLNTEAQDARGVQTNGLRPGTAETGFRWRRVYLRGSGCALRESSRPFNIL